MAESKEPKIIARLLIEVLGAPKAHIDETIRLYVDRIKQEPEIKIVREEYGEAEEREDKLFGVYVEIDVEVKRVAQLVWLCFDFMPSSVEILEQTVLTYEQREITDFLNDLQARLHKFDGLLKKLNAENKVLKKNSLTLAKNLFLVALKDGPKEMSELVSLSGVPEHTALKFLKTLEREGRVAENEGKYARA